MDHSFFMNCCWEIILVMTTVGFGDIYPRTLAGRIVIFCCCIYGVVVVSLVVVTIQNSLNMSREEYKAFLVLNKLKIKEKMKIHASHLVGVVGKLKNAHILGTSERISLVKTMAKHTNTFKILRQ
jgi:Ion channel